MSNLMQRVLQIFILFIFSLTVSIAQRVPEWSKSAVWYQIFPDRFSNGDESNDPTPTDMAGGWPYLVQNNWQLHPWNSDWYKRQPWENNEHDFYWNAGLRRYGGDLQGVINKLDYLQELGITALYFNPLFESPSLHKYDATMYHHIDNNFGPNPKLDIFTCRNEDPGNPQTWKWTSADSLFLKLISECHSRNIKVIIDGVFNHVGNTFWAFKDVEENQQNSKYKNWFTINSWDDPTTEKNEFDYEGWYGVKDLPEFREDENGLIENISNHIHDVVKRWMDPNQDGDPSDGIDGWRLDVAEMVKPIFWQKFRTWVKDINPEAYITGEIWWDDWQQNKMMNASPWLQGDQFDAVMNYRFTRSVKHFVSDNKNDGSPQDFVDSLESIQNDLPKENLYVLMNLLGSHDTERLASLIVNPDYWYDHNANPQQRKSFDVRKPNKIERLKQKLMVGIQMTMPGAPMIYYGDEAGMWGGDDPDCRKPMIWDEIKYEDENTHPFDVERPTDKVEFDSNLFDWYKKLISIRNDNEVLSKGDLTFHKIDNDENTLIYKRSLNNNFVLVLINNNENSKIITLSSNKNKFCNLISDIEYEVKNNNLEIVLPSYGIAILK
ncbi:MAG: glycoside hydrolase family 13 protein [Melioribacteraceae bacterium]